MRSSKVENFFDIDPSVEESKSLSPLTYYHPFQSSFDPEFGKPSSPTTCNQHNLVGTAKRLSNELESRKILGSHSKTRNEPGVPKSTFDNKNRCEKLYTWNSEEVERAKNNFTTRCGQWPLNPVWCYPRFFVSEDMDLRQHCYNRNSRESGINLVNNNRQALEFGSCNTSTFGARSTSILYDHTGTASTCNASSMKPITGNTQQTPHKTGHNRPMMCNFCKNNKEVPDIYLNHYLYDPDTKKLTCPVLRKHVCEICGETGDKAHTLQYCPINRQRGFQAKIPVLLKARTITNSTGKIRRN